MHSLSRFGLGFSAALLAFAGFAQTAAAAEVTLYGQMDAGLVYKDSKGASPTFTMDNGVDVSTLWGIRGTEELGGDKYVRFVLESGFDTDTGKINNGHTNSSNDLFSREAALTIGSRAVGEVSFGRLAGFLGSTGTYAQWAAMGMNPMQSNAPDAALLGAFDNSPIMDNTIIFKSRDMSGLTLLGLYSNGTANETGEFSKDTHMYSLAAGYKRADLSISAVWQMQTYPNSASSTYSEDAKPTHIFFLGAGKTFGDFRILAAYEHVENARRVFGGPNILSVAKFFGEDKINGRTLDQRSDKGFRVDSFSLGGFTHVGAGTLHASVKVARAEWRGDKVAEGYDTDGTRVVYATRYSYPLSKRTALYAIASYGDGSGMFDNTAQSQAVGTRAYGALGLHTKF